MLLTKQYSGDEIKKTEMGGAYSTVGGKKIYSQGFGGETCEGKTERLLESLRSRLKGNIKNDLQ